MSNTQQLSAEVKNEIFKKAEKYSEKFSGPSLKEAGNSGYAAQGYTAGATEYATKLYFSEESNKINLDEIGNLSRLIEEKHNKLQQAQQENTQLKQWKAEASEILNPILEYGQSKEAAIPLGQSITAVVLDRCKKYDAARTLLQKFISRHEGALIITDPELYNEIKQFLDGK